VTAIYRILKLGPPERGGGDSPVSAEIGGIAKTNDRCKYTIANELVAGHLAQVLALPVPAGVVATDTSGRPYFLSLDVGAENKALPPVVPRDFVAREPFVAAGCIAFDILIANPDRHAENLSLDPAFDPPRPSLFDHGAALLGSAALPNGSARLALFDDDLGCAGGRGVRNVLLDVLDSDEHLFTWVERIESLPDWVFAEACAVPHQIREVDMTEEERISLRDWLIDRASKIRTLVLTHKDEFPLVTTWALLWEVSA
jgi:hypothetical protein